MPIPKLTWLARLLKNNCVSAGPRAPNKPNPIAGNINNQGNMLVSNPNVTAGIALRVETPGREVEKRYNAANAMPTP